MTEYFTSFTMDYTSVLRNLELCDIIEFNRLTFSHYAFYIGGGNCVHVVTGEDHEKTSSGGMKKGRKCSMTLSAIANGSSCRINNLEASHFWRGIGGLKVIKRRNDTDAIALAVQGLPKDREGNVIVGATCDVPYMLMGQNCEAYSAYWRYEVPAHHSQQAYNSFLGSSLGTGQRLFDEAAAGYAGMARDRHLNPVGRVAAAVTSIPMKAAAITIGTVKAVSDGVTSVLVGIFSHN